MGNLVIQSLHKGMDLKDAALDVPPGSVGECLGIDFSEPGVLRPMRADVLLGTLSADIEDAHCVYIAGVQYFFTTHSDGLRVSTGGGGGIIDETGAILTDETGALAADPLTSTLIDAAFTGLFKVLPINDQYVVFSSASLVRKWMPGWSATEQWGLNTAPMPTLTAGTLTTQSIEECDSITSWVKAGGGAAGAITLDVTNYRSGTGSINLAASAKSTVTMTKSEALDLSKFVTAGDLGTGYVEFWILATDLTAVNSISLMFDCSAAGNFKTDWYQADVNISSVASKTVTYATGGTIDVTAGGYSSLVTPSGKTSTWLSDSADSEIITVGIPKSKTKSKSVVTYKTFSISDEPIDFNQVLVVKMTKRTTTTSSGVWMQFRFAQSEFLRTGATVNRDWSTITALRIKYVCGSTAGSINVDSVNLVGGGFPYGNYYFAVAYENSFGNYGPYSDYAGPLEVAGQSIVISGLTPDTDAQTVQRRVSVVGGSMTDPMVFYIADNTTTTYTYNLKDTDLSTIETNFNEDPPGVCTDMVETAGRVLMVSGNALYYSDIEFYEGYPAANYMIFPSETLNQIAVLGNQYVAVRGNKEYLIQMLGSDPSTWTVSSGAKEGSVSSRFLVDLGNGQHVWAGRQFFWQSTDTEYLPEIGYAVATFPQVFGAQAGELVYLAFTDTDGTPRVLRIDYRLGYPLAHYVYNISPTAIFADSVLKKVFYATGASIYQIDAGTTPLETKLTIPEQFNGSVKIKSFVSMILDLSGGPLSMQVVRERQTLAGSYTLPNSTIDGDPVSLPMGDTVSQGFILSSTTQDFTLVLPIKIDAGDAE
jgi:hypothetical protein